MICNNLKTVVCEVVYYSINTEVISPFRTGKKATLNRKHVKEQATLPHLIYPRFLHPLELHILEINSFQVKSNFEVAFRKPRKCSQKFQGAYGALLDSKVNLTVILDNARIRYSAFLMKFQMELEIWPL